jgi:hypothetical protein
MYIWNMIFVKHKSGRYGFYKFLTDLAIDYPYLNINTLKYHLSRKETKTKGPYRIDDLEIYKGEIKKVKK